ncbi:Putative VPS15 protein kinase [Rhizopus microsporus]|nr:Putative VPS15 protein kinase [Rhizopus microsporus]
MGNKISTVTAIAGIDSYVSELNDINYQKSIGNARFMKTILGRHERDGYVVVKIFVKPELGMSLKKRVKKLKEEYKTLSDVHNAFSFQRILETDRAAYLVRQYLYSNLYDRISTRPFLTTIEKKWIAYQLIRGVADFHSRKVYHGDIKTENVLVTSWNWAFIVDFASFKPTYLPEDNPADFSFFFDTSSRRTCYIAPERFYKAGTEIDQRIKMMDEDDYLNELTPEMDIFSLGCVIAELFLEGSSLFTLSQLFKYKSGEYNPSTSLNKIEDKNIRELVQHMIQIDPNARLSAQDYLTQWHGKAFPHYFYSFLYQYMSSLTDKVEQKDSTLFSALSSAYPNMTSRKLTDADEKIERVFFDFEKIMDYVSSEDVDEEKHKKRKGIAVNKILLSPEVTFPNQSHISSTHEDGVVYKPGEEGSLILLSFICSLIRNTLYPSSKLKALDILFALGERVPDDVKLDRLVPYLMCLLTDESALVRANAIKTLTRILCMVESISPINARIFPEYILPSLRSFTTDPDALVRSTYASCIALLAETALRFLEMTQSSYDSYLQELQSVIQEQTTLLLIDKSSSVKRALLTNITSLCVFFGRQKANDVLLSHMITYLNDKDWMLRSIKGVGTFVGARSLEEYILPLMIQALTDPEEFVVEKVLNSLTSLADLGLFPKMKIWEIVGIVWPLMCHPNIWIRDGSVGFISSAIRHLPKTDVWCIVYPLLRPFLRSDIADINEELLLENIESPIPRQVYEQAILWATKATIRSTFWKKQRESFKSGSSTIMGMNEKEDENSEEDVAFLERLRSVGMSLDDEEKLRHMRDYLFKVSRVKTRSNRPSSKDEYENMGKEEVLLKNLGVTPMTVFLPDLSHKIHNTKTSVQRTTIKAKPIRSHSREDLCKVNQMANQPHVRALAQDNPKTVPVPISTTGGSVETPKASPSDYSFGTSLPKSLERPKSIILTMDAIKSKNTRMDEPISLSMVEKCKSEDDKETLDVSSGTFKYQYKHSTDSKM